MRINQKKVEIEMARKCWAAKDLAAAMGTTSVTVHKLLKKTKEARPAAVGRLAKALGVPIEEIGI